MPTTKACCQAIIDQINFSDELTTRPMMGEFLLYYRGVLVGGIYDGQLLLKETPHNASCGLERVVPYPGAKRTMYCIDPSDPVLARELIMVAYADLAKAKK